MQLVSRKNWLLFLAAMLVVALGYMAITLSKQVRQPSSFESQMSKIEKQSDSDSVKDIEKDVMDTDLTDLDHELQDIEKELNQAY